MVQPGGAGRQGSGSCYEQGSLSLTSARSMKLYLLPDPTWPPMMSASVSSGVSASSARLDTWRMMDRQLPSVTPGAGRVEGRRASEGTEQSLHGEVWLAGGTNSSFSILMRQLGAGFMQYVHLVQEQGSSLWHKARHHTWQPPQQVDGALVDH